MSLAIQLHPDKKTAGFALIETMITFFVLAVGLLALTVMLVNGVKTNQGAYLRTQAVVLAQDMADRIRSNRADDYLDAANEDTSCTPTSGTASSCGASNMAGHDLFLWEEALAATLPLGSGVICLDSTPEDGDDAGDAACDGSGSAYAVKVWWDQDRDGLIDVDADGNIGERLVLSITR